MSAQIIQLYGRGFSPEARAPYAANIYNNTILAVQTLLQQSRRLVEEKGLDACRYSSALQPSADFMEHEVKGEMVRL